jgi:Flp pilus assembly protein TadG
MRAVTSLPRHAAISAWLRAFRDCVRASIPVETALVLPVMLLMLLGATEVGWLISANQRVSRVAATVADLAARTDRLNDGAVEEIFAAAANVAGALDLRGAGSVVISGITNQVGIGTRIAWQDPPDAPSRVGVPGGTPNLEGLTLQPGETILVAEVLLRFQPLAGLVINEVELYERSHQRARFGTVERVP